jgi:hypothetical protein
MTIIIIALTAMKVPTANALGGATLEGIGYRE